MSCADRVRLMIAIGNPPMVATGIFHRVSLAELKQTQPSWAVMLFTLPSVHVAAKWREPKLN